MPSSMERSAPAQNASLPEVMTTPFTAASAVVCFTIASSSLIEVSIEHVHRAAGNVPGDERDAVGVGLELEILEGHVVLPHASRRLSLIL